MVSVKLLGLLFQSRHALWNLWSSESVPITTAFLASTYTPEDVVYQSCCVEQAVHLRDWKLALN